MTGFRKKMKFLKHIRSHQFLYTRLNCIRTLRSTVWARKKFRMAFYTVCRNKSCSNFFNFRGFLGRRRRAENTLGYLYKMTLYSIAKLFYLIFYLHPLPEGKLYFVDGAASLNGT